MRLAEVPRRRFRGRRDALDVLVPLPHSKVPLPHVGIVAEGQAVSTANGTACLGPNPVLGHGRNGQAWVGVADNAAACGTHASRLWSRRDLSLRDMLAMTCPFCKTLGAFSPTWSGSSMPVPYRHFGSSGATQVHMLQCPNTECQMYVVGITVNAVLRDAWPTSSLGKTFPDVPTHIASAADEAHRCASIGAFRGAIALARAVVEATAKDKGVKSGNLMPKSTRWPSKERSPGA